MSEDSKPEPDPKIIVDDDWKTQVEKEKEALRSQQAEGPEEAKQETGEAMQLPEPSFMVLLSTLGSQAMAAMGLFPDPATGKPNVNLPMAKHFIDMLSMLQEKTKGNLSEEESAHLRDALHQLRMIYVSTSNAPAPGENKEPDEPKSSIELP
jgi:hypothetical protein